MINEAWWVLVLIRLTMLFGKAVWCNLDTLIFESCSFYQHSPIRSNMDNLIVKLCVVRSLDSLDETIGPFGKHISIKNEFPSISFGLFHEQINFPSLSLASVSSSTRRAFGFLALTKKLRLLAYSHELVRCSLVLTCRRTCYTRVEAPTSSLSSDNFHLWNQID